MRFLFILILALWTYPQHGWAELSTTAEVQLQTGTGQHTVSVFEYLTDSNHDLSLESIRQRKDWKANDRGNFNYGFSRESYWIKFRLSNMAPELRQWILEFEYAPLDIVDFYLIHNDGRITQKAGGDRRPFVERDIKYRTTNFTLSTAAEETLTVYLHVRSESSIQGPIILWSPQRFIEKASHELIGFSIYVGLLLAMILYNIFLYISIRDRSHLYYVLYVFFYGYTMTTVFGFTYQYITPGSPVFSNLVVPFSIAMGSAFILLFSHEFLKLQNYSIWMPRLFRVLMFWAACALVATPFSYALGIKLAASLTMIGAPCVFVAGIICLGKGYRPAFFFVLAFTLFLIGVTINQLIPFGIIEPSLFANYSVHFGSAIEMLLLSIALGDKIKYEQNQSRQKIMELNSQLQDEHRKIVSLNEHLEMRVEEQTRDIRSMLQHIRLGIFTIVDDGLIHKDYSTFLQRLFERTDLTGANAVDAIFANSDANQDTLSQMASILQSTLGEPEYSFELNEGSLVREVRKIGTDGQSKVLEIDWSPIVNRRNLIEKILVTIRDVTQFRELQEVASEKKKELEFIAEIVPVSREQFARFMYAADKHIDENERLIQANKTKSLDALKIILINMHTLKGTARALGLKKLTEVVHTAEHYAGLLQNDQLAWDQDRLRRDLQLVKNTFEYYRHVNDHVLERASKRSSIELDVAKVESILQEIADFHTQSLAPESRNLFQKIDFMLSKAFLQPASSVVSEILVSTQRLAKDLRKEPPKIEIIDPGFFLTREGADLLRNTLSHLTRNSMDHGIESRDERQAFGKPPCGTIRVSLSEENGVLELRYRDDGRGLGIHMIKNLALIRGLVDTVDKLTREELAHLIFVPGFSTSQSVNQISGRGMGMSAIKTYTESAGGGLSLELPPLQPGADDEFIAFAIVMHLPPRYYRSFPDSVLHKDTGYAA